MTLSQSLRSLLKKPRFDVLTLFVTNRCNARCASCFYWQELNSCVDLLSLEDYRLIAASMPPFEKLLLSGGEPTLEPTLPDVVDLFLTRPEQALVLPTNGLQTTLVLEQTRTLLQRHPRNRMVVGVSLDGPEATHDRIRGVTGAYRKALETLRELAHLRQEFPLLQVTTLTTVMQQNENEIIPFLETLHALDQADYYTVEPLRGRHPSEELAPPHIETLRRIQERCNILSFEALQKHHAQDAPLMLSHIRALNREQRHVLPGKRLRFPCLAGSVVGFLNRTAMSDFANSSTPSATFATLAGISTESGTARKPGTTPLHRHSRLFLHPLRQPGTKPALLAVLGVVASFRSVSNRKETVCLKSAWPGRIAFSILPKRPAAPLRR
jgi:MoaA/NifB/PqqE/SkfB family radical SAM enzyme